MKVTEISIVNGALGTVTKGLVKGLEDMELRGREESTQTTVLLRSARILRRVLETWGERKHQVTLVWKTRKEVNDIYIYIYIYIYILSSIDRSVSFYQNSSVWLGSKPGCIYIYHLLLYQKDSWVEHSIKSNLLQYVIHRM